MEICVRVRRAQSPRVAVVTPRMTLNAKYDRVAGRGCRCDYSRSDSGRCASRIVGRATVPVSRIAPGCNDRAPSRLCMGRGGQADARPGARQSHLGDGCCFVVLLGQKFRAPRSHPPLHFRRPSYDQWQRSLLHSTKLSEPVFKQKRKGTPGALLRSAQGAANGPARRFRRSAL
jgi:hypothetical protein